MSVDVGRCCTLLLWTQRPRKHIVCLWNWDSVCNRTRAITTTGLADAILDFRHKMISVDGCCSNWNSVKPRVWCWNNVPVRKIFGAPTISGCRGRHLVYAFILEKLLITFNPNSAHANLVNLRQLINCYWMHKNLHSFWSLGGHDCSHLEKNCAIFLSRYSTSAVPGRNFHELIEKTTKTLPVLKKYDFSSRPDHFDTGVTIRGLSRIVSYSHSQYLLVASISV